MSEQFVTRHVEGHVGVVTLNRPEKHNAVNDEMQEQIGEQIAASIDDSAVRAILLRGEGKSSCAGRDVSMLGHRAGNVSDFNFVRHAQSTRMQTIDCPKPIIAAVRGAAIGGGFELALSADMR